MDSEFAPPAVPENGEKGFPSVRYGPDGQSAVFECSKDVPSGWFDHPSKVNGAPDPSKVKADPKRPARAILIKALMARGVSFKPHAGAAELAALLAASDPFDGDKNGKPGGVRLDRKALFAALKEKDIPFKMTMKTAELEALLAEEA